jgi:hypothetical protein
MTGRRCFSNARIGTMVNRRTRLYERRQHTGMFRIVFMPVMDFLSRFILRGIV